LAFPGPILPPTPIPPRRRPLGARLGGGIALALVIILVAVLKVVLAGHGSDEPTRPSNPFDQTEAAAYPVAAVGIDSPAPAEVPGFTADAVGAALANVRSAMIAGRLDETMLYQHDRSALDPLFSSYGRSELDSLVDQKILGIVATRIADGYRLTDDGIRVKGTTSFEGTLVDGVKALVVHTNYVWVYPFTGELEQPGDHLVTIHDKIDWIFPAAGELDADHTGMYLGENSEYTANNIDCASLDSDLIALGKPVQTNQNVGDPNDVFDPNGSLDVPAALSC
jgi:hypothetical protein